MPSRTCLSLEPVFDQTMEPQTLDMDQWLGDEWLTGPETWQNYLSPIDEYNTVDPKYFQNIDDHSFSYDLLDSSFQLSSPISEFSPEDLFNTIDPTELWNKESMIIDNGSPTSSSDSNSAPATPQIKTKPIPKRNSNRKSSDHGFRCPGRTTHNLIEKKYRTNLNNKIMCLRERIPSLISSYDEEVCEDGDNKLLPMKVNKGVILQKAIDYITELEREKENQAVEIARLRSMTDERMRSLIYANAVRRRAMMRGQ